MDLNKRLIKYTLTYGSLDPNNTNKIKVLRSKSAEDRDDVVEFMLETFRYDSRCHSGDRYKLMVYHLLSIEILNKDEYDLLKE